MTVAARNWLLTSEKGEVCRDTIWLSSRPTDSGVHDEKKERQSSVHSVCIFMTSSAGIVSWCLCLAIFLFEMKRRNQGEKGFGKMSSTQKGLRNVSLRPVEAANIQDHWSSIGFDSIQTFGFAEIDISKYGQSSKKT